MVAYTPANNIKKISTGDESGTWGDSTNNNFDILDRTSNGFFTLDIQTLDTSGSGTAGSSANPYVLPLSPTALLSIGHYKAIRLISSGTLIADTHLKLEGDNNARVYMMQNDTTANTGIDVVVFQGTFSASRAAEVAKQQFAILLADGSGASTSSVRHVTEDISPLTKALTIVDATAAATTPQLTVESTNTTSGSGPFVDLERNPSEVGTANDLLGGVLFTGYNAATGTPEKIVYGAVQSKIKSPTDGSENGELNFSLASGGSSLSFLELSHDSAQAEVVVNTAGGDVDFRVEGDTLQNLLGTDAGDDLIFSGGKLSSSLATVVPRFQMLGTAASPAGVSILQNSADAVGPTLTLAKNRGTDASTNVILVDNDLIGEINFVGSTAGTNGAGMSTVSRLAGSISVIRDGGAPSNSSTVAGTMLFKTKYSDDTGGSTAPPDIRMTIRDTGAIGFGQNDSQNTPNTHSGGNRRRVLTSRGGSKGPVWYGTPGGVEFITSKTISSGDNSVVFDGSFGNNENPNFLTLLFNKYAYDAVMFSLEQVIPTTNGHRISSQLSVTSGSYDTGANYRLANVAKNSLFMNNGVGLSNVDTGLTQSMTLHSFASTAAGGGPNKAAIFSGGLFKATNGTFVSSVTTSAVYIPNLDVSGIRFFPSTDGIFNSSNTFSSGKIKMFGIRKSENPLYTSS